MNKGFSVKELMHRLRQWAEIQAVRPTREAADVSGGRDAELVLKQLIGASREFKDGQVFAGRRIPSKRQGRRREIDLIVCTPQMIHLMEVKNWSGRLEIDRGRWRQHRRSGDVVDHGDLIKTNMQKQDAVVEYLHDRGIAIDDALIRDHIVTQIIFMNRKMELDPAIEALPEIITRRELDRYLDRQPRSALVDQMFSTLIELCLATESKRAGKKPAAASIPPAKFKQITMCLSETTTWDQIHFFGSKVITGDVVRLQLGPHTYRRQELLELAGHKPIRLWWTRNPLWGFVKAATGLAPLGRVYLGKRPAAIEQTDLLTFHAVGDDEPKSHKLVELDQFVLG